MQHVVSGTRHQINNMLEYLISTIRKRKRKMLSKLYFTISISMTIL